jgi:acetyl esterase/lipase
MILEIHVYLYYLCLNIKVDLVDDYNPSLVRNQPYDVIPAYLIPYVGSMYIDPSQADRVSAVNRDLKDFPPVLVEVGDSEILQDQIMKLVDKLQSEGSQSTSSTPPYVECNTYTDMVHVFQMLGITNMPQISQSFQRMKEFLDKLDTLNNCVALATSQKMEREPLTNDACLDRD